MFDKNFSAMKIMNGDNTQYFINGKETTKEDYEKACEESDYNCNKFNSIAGKPLNELFWISSNSYYPFAYKIDSSKLKDNYVLTKTKNNNIQNKKENTEKEKTIDFDKLYNSYEVIDFLSKNDGFYAYCIDNGMSYIYLKDKEKDGLRILGEDFENECTKQDIKRYHLTYPLPMNPTTLNYRFKITPIPRQEKWIDCSVNEAMVKLQEKVLIRSLKDGQERQRFGRSGEVQSYTNDDIFRDIRDNCSWQYME